MQRRQFVAATGTVLAVGLAGCSGDGGGPDTSSPTAIVDSFYGKVQDLDSDTSGEDLLDEVDNFLHSESPLRDVLGEGGNQSEGEDRTISSVETELGDEDLGGDALNERFGLSFFGVSDSTVESLAEENAVVNTTIEYEEADTQEQEHLTATEDGDWLIFI
jgi:hypothetical protein